LEKKPSSENYLVTFSSVTMIVERTISKKILQWSKQYPVVTITGPRQSGKSTLCKHIFKNKPYISLEDIDERGLASRDPRGFLNRFPNGAVIDEVQRAPDLFSYIQTIVDHHNKDGFYILTGSSQFDLLENISQSLAGRTAIARLLPFSTSEVYTFDKDIPDLNHMLYAGFYPRIFDKKLDPTEAMSFYVNSYIERDVRKLINVQDISKFETFIKLCAGRTGQLLNLSSLGNDCGIDQTTVKRWLSVLEASFIIKLLRPYYRNFNKRLIKSPKLYFLDTGLIAYLLGIHSATQIETHPLRGAIFESFVLSEVLKARFNKGKADNLFFFRDSAGNEVDLILDRGGKATQIEIKSGQTVNKDFFKGLYYFSKINSDIEMSYLVFGGDRSHAENGIEVTSWRDIRNIAVQ
jgi:predicted AAA+ superfamily ATPase